MEAKWRKFKVDPSMRESLRYIPQELHEKYCEEFRRWANTVTPNELALIAEKAHTSVMYINHVKRGHQMASRDWNNRIIQTIQEVAPHTILKIDAMWL